MHDDESRAQFEAAKRASTGQLLLKAARLLDEMALQRIRAMPGAMPIRPAHSRLFPHLSSEGIRSTELAARLGVTKQAIAPLVADLVAWGLVEQVPDPSDGRARLVRWSVGAFEGLMHGLGVLAQVEAHWTEHIGAEKANALRDGLVALLDYLESDEAVP